MNEFSLKRTKVVATIGPASQELATLRALLLAGVNVFRLNFSHGTHADHARSIERVRKLSRELDMHVALMQDLPGPKVRTGPLAAGLDAVTLANHSHFFLTTEQVPGTAEGVSVNYAGLPRDVRVGDALYLSDGAIRLRIEAIEGDRIATHVEVGGALRAEQGLNYPDGTLALSAVTDRDLEHLAFGLDHGVDWVAVSFVKGPEDLERVRRFIADRGATTPTIAKIEKHEALERIDEILAATDAIMVARGDLGIEIPLERVPLVQKDLIARTNRAAKPVITATQMLESMISRPRPTRAEATDVANAIIDGSDAIMLSGETAIGAYPIDAVRTMSTIALEVERVYPHEDVRDQRMAGVEHTVETSIAEACTRLSESLHLKTIATGTMSGNTAIRIASFRPRARIAALTPVEEVARRLALVWGVESLVVERYSAFESLLEIVERRLVDAHMAHAGDVVAVTSGMPVGEGGTNVLKLHPIPQGS
jgi:pyruvate kinase